MSRQDFLVEIGTEELPPKALGSLVEAFATHVVKGLEDKQLAHGPVNSYASPRRLAVQIDRLQLQAPDQAIETWGPPEKVAFDDGGNPTRAAQAFMKKNAITVDQLELKDSPKGKRLYHCSQIPGVCAASIMPAIICDALEKLPIPKKMHWGAQRELFVRPVHWVVLLLGEQVLPATILGVECGALSRGHRFHHPDFLTVSRPSEYASLLYQQGRVMADFNQRRKRIKQQVESCAQSLGQGARAIVENSLLDEVTALVEWPVALSGQFDRRFLDVPAEALMSSMTGHQKYFPVVNAEGQLLPHFIFVANLESTDPAQVINGNERVIRPRLADAAFFFETDKKQTLESRLAKLDGIVFQSKLGSVGDKSRRVATLSRFIAHQIGADTQLAERAALLSKTDLSTEMVLEFPDLQGIAGYYYAQNDGEPDAVAAAIREQYLPRFSGDELPDTATGCVLALADRLDTLVGIFGINQAPSGSKDPYALRRAVLGIIRIIREKQYLALDLNDMIFEAIAGYRDLLCNTSVAEDVSQFIFDRYRAIYQEEGIATDTVLAVQNALRHKPDTAHNPCDVAKRIHAVEAFRKLPESTALAAANKRVQNILTKHAANLEPTPVSQLLLNDDYERALNGRIIDMAEIVPALCNDGNYRGALETLAAMKAPIDDFFDHVMVMDEDQALRNNRLNLLRELHQLFIRIADIAQLQERVAS